MRGGCRFVPTPRPAPRPLPLPRHQRMLGLRSPPSLPHPPVRVRRVLAFTFFHNRCFAWNFHAFDSSCALLSCLYRSSCAQTPPTFAVPQTHDSSATHLPHCALSPVTEKVAARGRRYCQVFPQGNGGLDCRAWKCACGEAEKRPQWRRRGPNKAVISSKAHWDVHAGQGAFVLPACLSLLACALDA